MEYSFRACKLEDIEFLFDLKKQNFKYYVDKIWGWKDTEQRKRLEQDLKEHLSDKRIIRVNNTDIRNICYSYDRRRRYVYKWNKYIKRIPK